MTNTTQADRNLLSFAARMKRIPRKAVKCDMYDGVTYIVVDERHARNLLDKVTPGASSVAMYDALVILRDRLASEIGEVC